MTPAQEFEIKQNRSRSFHKLSEVQEKDILSNFPDKKYFEFVHHIWLNKIDGDLETVWNQWEPWDEWSYPIDDLLRYNKIIFNNSDIIRGRKVADLGSHLGIGVLFSLVAGASNCLAVEPFQSKNDLASFVCRKAGFDNFQFITGDVKDQKIYDKMKGTETLILGSLLDQVPDHYNVIGKIATTGVHNIIIEGLEHEQYARSNTPFIDWQLDEPDHKHEGPFNANVKRPLHGAPNLSFLKMLLDQFDYEFIKQEFLQMNTDTDRPRLRSVSVFRKTQKENR